MTLIQFESPMNRSYVTWYGSYPENSQTLTSPTPAQHQLETETPKEDRASHQGLTRYGALSASEM